MSIYHLPRDVAYDLLGDMAEHSECMAEFGPHLDHSDCDRILADMSPDFPDQIDYSDWYGGEQGYQDGLRWSDFV
jgi:hypothetical protein